MISVKLDNAKLIEKRLASLPSKVAKKIVRSAVRAGQKPVLAAAKSNAQTMVGGNMGRVIAKSLVLRAFKRQRRGSFGVNVRLLSTTEDAKRKTSLGVSGFRHKTKAGTEYYIPAAIEYGHDAVAGIPFMRSAFDATRKQAEKIVGAEIMAGITRELGVK